MEKIEDLKLEGYKPCLMILQRENSENDFDIYFDEDVIPKGKAKEGKSILGDMFVTMARRHESIAVACMEVAGDIYKNHIKMEMEKKNSSPQKKKKLS